MALITCAALVSGCATSGMRVPGGYPAPDQRVSDAPRRAMDRQLLAEYVQKLRLGSKVRVDKVDGRAIKGTLVKATDQAVVVQERTRVPEPPVEIGLEEIVAVTPEFGNGGLGRAIGAGLAAGVGGTLLVFAILAAIWD